MITHLANSLLLLVMVPNSHNAYSETVFGTEYEQTGIFRSDYPYPDRRPVGLSEQGRMSDRVPPSFKREFVHTDYNRVSQGQDIEQYLQHMGYRLSLIHI